MLSFILVSFSIQNEYPGAGDPSIQDLGLKIFSALLELGNGRWSCAQVESAPRTGRFVLNDSRQVLVVRRLQHRWERNWERMAYRYAKSRRDGSQADVSRYGTFRALSPFAVYPGKIPIPGKLSYAWRSDWEAGEDLLGWSADSVEGVWQGLKCLDNGTDERLFRGQPKKRRGRPDGHLYGDYRLLDYGQAKALIYIPTYLELVRQHSEVIAGLDPALEIVDVSYQPDTLGPKPISHAALLVDHLNGRLEPYHQAHRRLLELAARMEQCPTGAAEFVEMGERVRQLGFPATHTYVDCALLFERENLLLMAVHTSGCADELEPLTALLRQWRREGLLTRGEASDLAETAPLSRMGDWWVDEP